MQFKNKENPCLDLKDGGKIWKSRNVAVSVMIVNEDNEVFLIKRGKDMTHKGMWCFPCGYLDWNETVEEAAIREVYEETGFILNKEDLHFVGIDSDPTKFSQNVSVMYVTHDPKRYNINSTIDPNEVEEIKWISLFDLPDMAFDHKERCLAYIATLNSFDEDDKYYDNCH